MSMSCWAHPLTLLRWVLTCAFAGAALVPTCVLAQDETESYRATISAALERYRAGDWAEARSRFEHAYSLAPGARALRGVALSAYYQGDFATAARALDRALRDEREALSPDQREQARTLLDRAYQRIAQVKLTTRPTPVDVRVNGTEAENDGLLLLAAGHYRIELTCPGCEPAVREVDVAAGQQLELHIELALVPAQTAAATPSQASPAKLPQPTPLPPPALASPALVSSGPGAPVYIAAGTTLALLASGATFALLSQNELSSLQTRCESAGCTAKRRDALWHSSPIETYETLTNVAIVASALGAVTTATLWLLDAESDPDAAPSASLRTNGTGLSIAGRF